MKSSPFRRTSICAVLLFALCTCLHAQTASQKVTLHLDPSRTEIHWRLGGALHNVRGTFKLKGGLVSFDPQTGEAEGEVLVDVTTGESGDRSRDNRMQTEVLQSAKYPQAIFHPSRVTGTVKAGASQNITVEGTFTIHGDDHPLKLEMKVQIDGQQVTATTHFIVPYVAWGMKDPGRFMLRMDKSVDVDVTSRGALDGLP
jgi:polyisoprenoid-binding protein YceI